MSLSVVQGLKNVAGRSGFVSYMESGGKHSVFSRLDTVLPYCCCHWLCFVDAALLLLSLVGF